MANEISPTAKDTAKSQVLQAEILRQSKRLPIWASRWLDGSAVADRIPRVELDPDKTAREVVEGTAADAARIFKEWLQDEVEHLLGIGVPPYQVAEYYEQEKQTLSRLYFKAQAPAPSPTHLRRLAFQYALDARKPVD